MKFLQIFKKDKINEFEDLQTQFWHNVSFIGKGWEKEDIIVTREIRTICVGEFSSYDVYIPTNYLSFNELRKIKHYSIISISKYLNGLKIHVLSNRTKDQTTNKEIDV